MNDAEQGQLGPRRSRGSLPGGGAAGRAQREQYHAVAAVWESPLSAGTARRPRCPAGKDGGYGSCTRKTTKKKFPRPFSRLARGRPALVLGVVTVILGLIVSFRPSGSLAVIAVLLGILMIISGIFHLIRVFDRAERHRVWLGIAGLLYVVIGVLQIRHLNLTVAFIGLVVGLTWII